MDRIFVFIFLIKHNTGVSVIDFISGYTLFNFSHYLSQVTPYLGSVYRLLQCAVEEVSNSLI